MNTARPSTSLGGRSAGAGGVSRPGTNPRAMGSTAARPAADGFSTPRRAGGGKPGITSLDFPGGGNRRRGFFRPLSGGAPCSPTRPRGRFRLIRRIGEIAGHHPSADARSAAFRRCAERIWPGPCAETIGSGTAHHPSAEAASAGAVLVAKWTMRRRSGHAGSIPAQPALDLLPCSVRRSGSGRAASACLVSGVLPPLPGGVAKDNRGCVAVAVAPAIQPLSGGARPIPDLPDLCAGGSRDAAHPPSAAPIRNNQRGTGMQVVGGDARTLRHSPAFAAALEHYGAAA